MVRSVILVLVSVVVIVLAILVVFVFGMRGRWPPVVDAVRALNRRVFNPRQLRSAGTEGAYASIVHHVGRNSGRRYDTPIVANPVDDGFIVALPYGTRADWVRNVLAADTAELTREGRRHRLSEPAIRPLGNYGHAISASDRRAHGWFGVDDCLHVHADPPPASTA